MNDTRKRLNFDEIQVPKNMIFNDISTESERTYHFPGGDIQTIIDPLALCVTKSGTHRLIDESGESHIIPVGWHRISFLAKPHFVI